jgi:hypothetical protein
VAQLQPIARIAAASSSLDEVRKYAYWALPNRQVPVSEVAVPASGDRAQQEVVARKRLLAANPPAKAGLPLARSANMEIKALPTAASGSVLTRVPAKADVRVDCGHNHCGNGWAGVTVTSGKQTIRGFNPHRLSARASDRQAHRAQDRRLVQREERDSARPKEDGDCHNNSLRRSFHCEFRSHGPRAGAIVE